MGKDSREVVAEVKLLVDEEGGFHVETAIFNDDQVSPEDLVNMMGLGVWDVIKKSLWGHATANAKAVGVTDDRWDEFVEKIDYLISCEVEQFTFAIIAAATAPLALHGENALDEFEQLFKFVEEFEIMHKANIGKE